MSMKKKITCQVEKSNDDVQETCFETKRKNVHFYYMPSAKDDIPPCPKDTKSWQKFYGNNKIASRSIRTKQAAHHADENSDKHRNRPRQEAATTP
jgi:hypothetical protein